MWFASGPFSSLRKHPKWNTKPSRVFYKPSTLKQERQVLKLSLTLLISSTPWMCKCDQFISQNLFFENDFLAFAGREEKEGSEWGGKIEKDGRCTHLSYFYIAHRNKCAIHVHESTSVHLHSFVGHGRKYVWAIAVLILIKRFRVLWGCPKLSSKTSFLFIKTKQTGRLQSHPSWKKSLMTFFLLQGDLINLERSSFEDFAKQILQILLYRKPTYRRLNSFFWHLDSIWMFDIHVV